MAEGEVELGTTFLNLQLFQLTLIIAGYFIRGAIAAGDFFVDSNVIYGKALIEAYDAERTLARDPRVVLTATAVSYDQEHISYYASPEGAPQYYNILKDADGQYFLNYLEILDNIYEGPFFLEITDHKIIVEEMLRRFSHAPAVWSKYEWVANYHNYFCINSEFYDQDKYRIDLNEYHLRPSRIV